MKTCPTFFICYQHESPLANLPIVVVLFLVFFSQDYRWSCGRECDTETFTSPENDPEELKEMWTNLQRCGDPCGCS